MAASIPSGTVTFLFTDIEGSASLAQQSPDTMQTVLAQHNAILQNAVEAHGGIVFQIVGDAFCAAFHTIGDAMQAALDAQYALEREDWAPAPVKVRMGINTGTARAVTENPEAVGYAGYLTLTRTQRVMSTAHGGQILLSNASADLAREELEGDVNLRDLMNLRDLGEYRLKGLPDLEHVWQVLSPGLREDFPLPSSSESIPTNLPIQVSSFVGREREIRELIQLLESHRLVTLTGPGGTGKTRLSVQVAAEVLERFKHGVWFVELAPLSDPALVTSTVASALGVREEQSRPLAETLLDWLSTRELLLVLDNCEHLIGPCARFAEALLRSSEGCRILASSREALGILGEQTYLVPSLECPSSALASQIPIKDLVQYPAVRLFADRARESVATFRVNPSNAPAVVEICCRLDGMPLALELAAARVKLLQVEQIAERLDDRFRFLTSGGRTMLPRHQTLRALIDWSYDLLTEQEQILLRRLSVFVGGWSLHAAEQVCTGDGIEAQDVLELLGRLVDKSLVVASKGARGSRFHMLETIREYARERLQDSAEADILRDKHLGYILQLAEEAEPHLYDSEYQFWFGRLELERDNWRAALEWARARQQTEAGLRLAGALYAFWELRGYWSEGYEATASLLKATTGQKSTIRGKAAVAAGKLSSDCGYSAEMRAYFEEGLQILRESGESGKRWLGFSLSQYGIALVDRDIRRAQSVSEEGIRVSRETGDVLGLACSLFAMGMATRRQANFDAAHSAQEESMRLFQKLGNQPMYALLLSNLAYTHYYKGNLSDAKECYDESIRLAQEIGDRYVEANSLPGRGDLARRQGNYEEAEALLERGLAYHRSIGTAHQGLIYDLHSLGLLQLSMGNMAQASSYLKEGVRAVKEAHLRYWLRMLFDALGYLASAKEPARAARLFGAAERLREQMGIGLFPYEHDEYEKYVHLAQAQVDPARWEAARLEGWEMTLEQSIEYALQSG